MKGRIAGLALILLAAWEIGVLWRSKRAAPTDADWQQVVAAVTASHQPGDLIVFAPSWMDPVGRKWLGGLMTIDQAARMDDARYGRAWEISARGAAAPETEGAGTPAYESRFGALRVRQFTRPAAQVTWDLSAHSALQEVDFQPRKCARIGEPRPGRPAVLDVPSATLGMELVVRAGLADFRERRENRAVALVRVIVDGEEKARAQVGNESGWLPLPRVATNPGVHQVRFEATVDPSRGDPQRATLSVCIAAEARL
ncbi:MAG: hypothetical protein HY698_06225 [Deltaproteobacteria bacterium]|nr:hypothetical protein [Deltaproteobacteria bacterium]